ncbi:hypothetical protein TNCV_2451681 [Trichonephila clavipes]|nr:hypothetical protein TNCV_2451681 [Trichonephila clavipes]
MTISSGRLTGAIVANQPSSFREDSPPFIEMNQTRFKYVEEWSETYITGNNSFQWCFLTSSQVNWADMENCVEFLSKKMHDIKIDDNCLFEKELED